MTTQADFLWLQVQDVDGVSVARITATELWTDQQVGRLAAELMHLVDDLEEPRLVLDCSAVTGMGSRMIGQVAALHKLIRGAGGRLVLCHVGADIAQVIETCKLTTLFGLYPDVPTAVRSFAAG